MRLVFNEHDDGYFWVALAFTKLLLDGKLLNVDAHITLVKMKPPGCKDMFIKKLQEVSSIVEKTKDHHFVIAGVFHEELAVEHYAWINLLANCAMYSCCHRIMNEVCKNSRGWRRPTFHCSFRSWDQAWYSTHV